MNRPTVIIVPGLRDHVEDHWQTHLDKRLTDAVCVPFLGRERHDLTERVEALDETIRGTEGPVVLVAHSAGALITVHWAARHAADHVGRIQGVLLATPPDLVSPLGPGHPAIEDLAVDGWLPIPLQGLPFPSIVAASTDDPIGDLGRVRDLAAAWGSDVHVLGAVGHLNPASGYGQWPGVDVLLEPLGVTVQANA
ncbi:MULTISPECIES: RBBP9/YdeN family alpha/beta hydrolase [unclassified Nocardioides]|uniref:RBBP9/YdeN family alpha/beta hydrolase n=1 Tax=unclassified Nocardioides TaxID=2615069 RepID=UPI0006F34FFC|nr:MULTISPECIES: alpha/beta fold hydrolase [unclassified Nocardioides]KQY56437.1 alpha/beta hydrolase [Nocardioides sp. Root140]KQZ75196.1 alpha/beta hydrolase [Nocardioides sp. Root151]KRF14274.1 alpha/beta hydrolase [Nocardioides sp. Soil796]